MLGTDAKVMGIEHTNLPYSVLTFNKVMYVAETHIRAACQDKYRISKRMRYRRKRKKRYKTREIKSNKEAHKHEKESWREYKNDSGV
jgi:hypothetical protein